MKAKKSLVILDSSIQFDQFKKFSRENTIFVAADYETHKKLVDSNTKHELLDNYLTFTKVGWVYHYCAIPNNGKGEASYYFMKKTYETLWGEE